MYDIEIAVPVTQNGKYRQRLEDFKKYGLLNTTGKKVFVKLLVGTETIKDIEKGWPRSVVAVPVSSPKDHAPGKVFHYYSSHLANETLDAKWYARFDDDSVTDVGGLIDRLDKEFDWNDAHYLGTHLNRHLNEEEVNVLVKMGLHDLIRNPPPHEWEACYATRAAIRRIIGSPAAVNMMRLRSEIGSGVYDQGLAVAARIVKIHASDAPFSCKDPVVDGLSLWGGPFCHIHYMARDINEGRYLSMVYRYDPALGVKNGFFGADTGLARRLSGSEFVFFDNHKTHGVVKFSPNGQLDGYRHPNEWFWCVRNDVLEFVSIDCVASTRFTKNDKDIHFSGPHAFPPFGELHLRKLVPLS